MIELCYCLGVESAQFPEVDAEVIGLTLIGGNAYMEFRYEVQVTERGLPRVAEDMEAELHIRHQDGQIYVVGNQAGLIHLAKCLISLALVPNQPRGFHFHLDPVMVLDQDSTPVLIYNDAVFRDE